jgi:hypothetical protein
MYNELYQKKKALSELIKSNEYLVIAPSNSDLFAQWVKTTSRLAPASFISTLHNALSDEDAGKRALTFFSSDIPLTIYVITDTGDNPLLLYDQMESYCEKNGIKL